MQSRKEEKLNKKVTHNSCKLCGSSKISGLFICKDHFVSGEEFPVFKCHDCGFTFSNNYPDEEVIGEYYKSDNYISHSDTHIGLVNKLYHHARAIMLSRKYRIVGKYSRLKRGTLLDIGCGTGYFAKYMISKGWDVTGIEKDNQARLYAESVNKVKVFDNQELNNLEPSSYDCISLWHVLEHFHDPDSLLEIIVKSLKDNGIIVIALPNNNSFDASHYKAFWAAWDVPRHLWHFTSATITKYLQPFGLEIIAVKRLPFDAFYVSILSEKYKNGRPGLLKGLLVGTASWIRSLFDIKSTSSLVYIVRKA